MRIKNKRELVLRALGHARLDHIAQGTYGSASCNGEVEFKGCAIGCLATPHRKGELRSFIRRLGELICGEYELEEAGTDQIPRLKREFGICPELARVAEAFFESQPTHGAAIEFIPEFAKALPEGANITPRKVRKFWEESLGGAYVDKVHAGSWSAAEGPEAKRKLFAWLESLA